MVKSFREKNLEFARKLKGLLSEYNVEIVPTGKTMTVLMDRRLMATYNEDEWLRADSVKVSPASIDVRFEPTKRTAPDGKTWWVVWDAERNNYSAYTCHGKYRTKRECVDAIDRSIDIILKGYTSK